MVTCSILHCLQGDIGDEHHRFHFASLCEADLESRARWQVAETVDTAGGWP